MSPIAANVTSIEKRGDQYQRNRSNPSEISRLCWLEGKSIDLPGCYFLKLARIPNEDPAYPNIFLGMVFLRSSGHLAKPRNCIGFVNVCFGPAAIRSSRI